MPRAKRVLTHAEVALCTTGICFDVVGLQYGVIPSDEMKKIVDEFPRLVMHLKVTHYPRLGNKSRTTCRFCSIAQSHPQTTYYNFVRDFGERFVPGY